MEHALAVVDGVEEGVVKAVEVAVPVSYCMGVGAAEALALWLTLGEPEGEAPAVREASAVTETVELPDRACDGMALLDGDVLPVLDCDAPKVSEVRR